MRRFVQILCLLIFFSSQASFAAQSQAAQGAPDARPRRVLIASLYPYIPDAGAAYFAVEEAFERANPDIDLQIHLLGDTYYDHRPRRRNILADEAHVYEVDSVFLADFIRAGKAAPLGSGFADLAASLVPFARDLATRNGELYGMPHWLCGNFLIYRAGDQSLEAARTFADIERAFRSNPSAGWLLADFFGTSTLGEMYLDGAMDATGAPDAALQRVMAPELDAQIVGAMTRAVAIFRPGFGRDSDYHDRPGFYARQFARGQGRAFVGYSEQLYYALSESTLSCRRDENCLASDQVRVAEWPLADAGSSPIAWVDMLLIDADAAGQTRADAERFVRFMAEPATYRLLLMPQWPNPPRYLLPAREDMYSDPALDQAAPLYRQFRARIANARPITGLGLNARLRETGGQLNQALPQSAASQAR
jgi:thiamine pyridinylase